MALNTSRTLNAPANMIASLHSKFHCEHLDIGAELGARITMLRSRFDTQSSVSDYTEELMSLKDVSVKVADLCNQRLSFEDSSFDLVTRK
jgi:hypothetical protein